MAAASIHFGKAAPSSKELRKRGRTWLKAKRQEAGLSQMDLAQKLNFKYYTFISQVENGFGRVPSESMEAWGLALGLAPVDFARHLLSYYDPDLHRLLFERPDDRRSVVSRREADPWRLDELVELDRLMPLLAGRAGARSWETGVTERGEPQFYVRARPRPALRHLRFPPRRGLVLEDGSARVLAEDRCLRELVKRASRAIPRPRRIPLAARAFLALCAGRAFVEEKMVAFEELLSCWRGLPDSSADA